MIPWAWIAGVTVVAFALGWYFGPDPPRTMYWWKRHAR